MTPGRRQRIVVGISGSSAPHLGVRLLEVLAELPGVETHLVISRGAHRSLELEMGRAPASLAALADATYDDGDLAASISSGSFLTDGMVVAPCSMRSLAGIAHGTSDNLLLRAADVTLKERRKLVLVTRETPLSLIHIRNMELVTLAGAVVLPPVPAFYHRPATIDDLLTHLVGKILDQLGIAHRLFERWPPVG
jgi:polyprenyl P-hydroxybenzoate/phenylacrylic acid decarboxylase-like protein